MQMKRAVMLILIGAALAQQAQAQSLAAAAKREKERRAKLKSEAEAKTYGNADLEKTQGKLANDPSDPAAVGQQATPAPASAATTTSRDAARGERYWRSRAKQLRQNVAAAEADLRAAKRKAATAGPATRGDYRVPCKPGRILMPDGSLGPVTDNCATTGLAHGQSRAAQARVEGAERALEAARQALARFQEEARRARALPGWVR